MVTLEDLIEVIVGDIPNRKILNRNRDMYTAFLEV